MISNEVIDLGKFQEVVDFDQSIAFLEKKMSYYGNFRLMDLIPLDLFPLDLSFEVISFRSFCIRLLLQFAD